jgi:hypothetical protein
MEGRDAVRRIIDPGFRGTESLGMIWTGIVYLNGLGQT